VAAEKNSRVIIVPVPVELLRFLDRVASAAGRARRPGRAARPQPVVHTEASRREKPARQSPQSPLP